MLSGASTLSWKKKKRIGVHSNVTINPLSNQPHSQQPLDEVKTSFDRFYQETWFRLSSFLSQEHVCLRLHVSWVWHFGIMLHSTKAKIQSEEEQWQHHRLGPTSILVSLCQTSSTQQMHSLFLFDHRQQDSLFNNWSRYGLAEICSSYSCLPVLRKAASGGEQVLECVMMIISILTT